MKVVTPRKPLDERLKDDLVPLLEAWQSNHPDRLIATAHITREAPRELEVTRAKVGMYLTEAVADGTLVEVLVRRDWLVMLPGGEDLPALYPTPVLNAYQMVQTRPKSRGSDGISFILTPAAYETFLEHMREEHLVRG